MNQHATQLAPFDSRAFRRCLGQFSTGVTIVTAQVDGQNVGVTANSFSSLSLDPPLILWSIARTSRAFDAFAHAERFCVSILADDQIAMSQRFSSKEGDRFTAGGWTSGLNGAPVIAGCAAVLECSTEAMHDGGDHIIIIGRVTHFVTEQRNPLVFSQGRYCIGVDHPDHWEARRDTAVGSAANIPTMNDSLGTLVFEACMSWRAGFDSHRKSARLTPLTGRVLYVLSRHIELSIDSLVRRTDLPAQDVEDEVGRLCQSGEVEVTAGASLRLTKAGIARRELLKREVVAYEGEILNGIASNDIAVTKKTLVRYLSNAALSDFR